MRFKKGEIPVGAKPFKKGQSGNPKGRPEGARTRSTVLREWLSQSISLRNPLTGETEKKDLEHEIVLAWIAKARKGDMVAIRELMDTLYGKLTEKVQLDVNQLDNDIDRELARLAAGGEGSAAGEAEGEVIH